MDKRKQMVLAAQLHGQLVDQMGSVSRLAYIMTGRAVDPMSLVEAMERDLLTEIARIGTEPSVYDVEELQTRAAIARRVVIAIRSEVSAQR